MIEFFYWVFRGKRDFDKFCYETQRELQFLRGELQRVARVARAAQDVNS